MKRWTLGTPYTEIVAGLVKFTATLRSALLVIDGTGVGAAVCDMVNRELLKAHAADSSHTLPLRWKTCSVTITGGLAVSQVGSGRWHVAKKELVSVLQVLLQTRRIHVADSLPEAKTLVRELQTFRVKITAAGNESFESWRERDHDDLVLAVALACWAAERLQFDLC